MARRAIRRKSRRDSTSARHFSNMSNGSHSTNGRAAKAYAEERGVALMGDIPFGVNYYSADVFSRRG